MNDPSEIEMFDLSRNLDWKRYIKWGLLVVMVILNMALHGNIIAALPLLVGNILLVVLFAPHLISTGISFSRKQGIPISILGLVIFPLLSSFHEVLISVVSNLKNPSLSEIMLGQQLSNKMFEMMASFGVIGYFACQKNQCLSVKASSRPVVIRNGLFMIIAISFLAFSIFVDNAFTAIDGIGLIIIYLFFLVAAFYQSLKGIETFTPEEIEEMRSDRDKMVDLGILFIIVFLFSFLASNISDQSTLLFLTIPYFQKFSFIVMGIAFAMPNFIVTLISVRKGEVTLGIAYAIGSVIWELTMAVATLSFTGGLSTLSSLTSGTLAVSLLVMAVLSLIYIRTRWTLHAWESIIIISIYIGTIAIILFL